MLCAPCKACNKRWMRVHRVSPKVDVMGQMSSSSDRNKPRTLKWQSGRHPQPTSSPLLLRMTSSGVDPGKPWPACSIWEAV